VKHWIPDQRTELFFRRLSDAAVVVFGLWCAFLVILAPQEPSLVPVRAAVCLAPGSLLLLFESLLRRRPHSRWLWIARYATPLLFLTFFFRLTGQVNPFFELGRFDEVIIKLDGFIFGDPYLSMHFQETSPFSSPVFGEFMCLSYVAYFFFLPVFGGILIVRGLWRQPGPSALCSWYVSCVVLTYYLHYFAFFLFPVAGPAFHLDKGIALDPGFVINRLHHAIVSRGDVPGGCFPSSHVAVALIHTFIARRLGWPLLTVICTVITVSICFSIVYTRAHYATDAPAGLLSGLLCWLLWRAVERAAARFTSR